ncbi:MAG: type II toxin-antitoxin system RelE/ParE family toxin [Bosea sp. (in: a-proteobacteria)]
MQIRSIRHRGLRRLVEQGDGAAFPPAIADKLGKMVLFLQDMLREQELEDAGLWRAHRLTGDRKGMWSLHVTRNWRLAFRIDQNAIAIVDLDYEDYH